MTNGRILYLDAIKAVLMFLVIWGHVIQYTNAQEGLDNPIAAFIYSFHMPMFMMLSGMFFKKQLQLRIFEMLRKNFKRLLLPALVICISLFLLVCINKPRGINESINWLWFSRPWFVTTLFFCNATTCFVYRFCKRIGLSFIFTFVLFCLIPSISDRLIFMYPYFVFGYYLNELMCKNMLMSGVKSLCFFVFCLLFGLNSSDVTIYSTPYTLWNINDGVHFDASLGIAFKRYFIGLCGSLGVFFILKNLFCGIAEPFCRLRIIRYIGTNTLGLYLCRLLCLLYTWVYVMKLCRI